jgi:hypothetical protein
MLNISLRELPGGAAEQVLAHEVRPGVDERHHVLQLIAETEGPTRLVGSAARPKTARQSLVQEPSVDQHIERRIRCFHLNGAECVIPVLPHRLREPARSGRSPEAIRQVAGVIGVTSYAEREDDLTLFPVRYLEGHMDRCAGIQSGPHLARNRDRVMAAGLRSVPLRPMNSVRSPLTVRAASSTSKKATRSANSVL